MTEKLECKCKDEDFLKDKFYEFFKEYFDSVDREVHSGYGGIFKPLGYENPDAGYFIKIILRMMSQFHESMKRASRDDQI